MKLAYAVFTLLLFCSQSFCLHSYAWSTSLQAEIAPSDYQPLTSDIPQVKGWSIPGCTGGRAVVTTFPFASEKFRRKYEISVFSEGRKTTHELVQHLEKKGVRLIALINGGYFNTTTPSSIYSYYRSSFTNKAWPRNSTLSPRACMVWNRKTNAFTLLQSSENNFKLFSLLEDVEIWCAGPQVVNEGKDVSETQFCAEKFSPKCRADRQDPGIGFYTEWPRTGSCYTIHGELKLFSFNSSVERCGASIKQLAQIMIQEECFSGMNHDGGGSSALYTHFPNSGEGFWPDRLNRRVPVWIGVFEKNASEL